MRNLLALLALAAISSLSHAASNVLLWDYPVAEEARVTTFNVERKTAACAAAGTFSEIGTVAKTLRTYTDSTAVEGATYCYQVRAVGPGGASDYSNQVGKTVPFGAPSAPTNLRFQ